MHRLFAITLLIVGSLAMADTQKSKMTAREALQPFNELVGPWRANGEPEGVSPAERQKGFWKESVSWSWKFKGDDCWITVAFGKGKHFKNGEIRYLADKDKYQLTLTGIDNKPQVFEGQFNESKRSIAFERTDETKKEDQRLTIDFVEDIRFVYRYEYKPEGRKQFVKAFKVGATKEGESFAGAGGRRGRSASSAAAWARSRSAQGDDLLRLLHRLPRRLQGEPGEVHQGVRGEEGEGGSEVGKESGIRNRESGGV